MDVTDGAGNCAKLFIQTTPQTLGKLRCYTRVQALTGGGGGKGQAPSAFSPWSFVSHRRVCGASRYDTATAAGPTGDYMY